MSPRWLLSLVLFLSFAHLDPTIAHAQREPRAQLQSLERELAELDATLAPSHDDGAALALAGLGGASFAAGIIGTTIALTTAPCTSYGGGSPTPYAAEYGYPIGSSCLHHAEDWGLIAGMLVLSGIGAALTITGVVWADANGRPYRRRARLERRIERMRERLDVSVSITPGMAAVTLTGHF